LVGNLSNTSSITNSYSRGSVTGNTNVGGLVGYNYESTVITSYWDTQTSGQSSSAGGGGRLSVDMTSPYTSNTYVGWDFSTTWAEDSDYYVSSGYPYLQWQSTIPGLAAPSNLTAYYDPEFDATYLSWDAVPYASSYHVYGSLVEIDPSFVLLGNSYETAYNDNSGSLVYMVIAVSGSVESAPSNYAYINRMQPVQASLSIDTTHSNAVLTWPRTREADAYEVYYAEDPYALFPSGWTGPIVITDNNYIEPLTAQRFYRVLARIPQRNIKHPNTGKSGK
jgi:hypothetical protein